MGERNRGKGPYNTKFLGLVEEQSVPSVLTGARKEGSPPSGSKSADGPVGWCGAKSAGYDLYHRVPFAALALPAPRRKSDGPRAVPEAISRVSVEVPPFSQ